MLMYTKYISLHYFNYLSFCVSHTGSVNCIGLLIVSLLHYYVAKINMYLHAIITKYVLYISVWVMFV